MHGMIMVIYLLTALFLGGFGNYLIPLMVGARDMVFPYVNMLSYWIYLLAVLVLLSSMFVPGGPTGAGWTLYPPQAILSGTPGSGAGIILMLVSLALFIIGFTMGGLNYVVTVLQARTRGMTLMRMPLTVWGIFVATILALLAFPALFVGRRHDDLGQGPGTSFFMPAIVELGELRDYDGGSPLLFQHLFWFFGHPEVYIVALPAFRHRFRSDQRPCATEYLRLPDDGLGDRDHRRPELHRLGASYVCQRHEPVFRFLLRHDDADHRRSDRAQGLQLDADPVAGQYPPNRPHAVCHRLHRHLRERRHYRACSSATWLSMFRLSDTMFVVAHFHMVMGVAPILVIFGAIYHWYPKDDPGACTTTPWASLHFWITFLGAYTIFLPLHYLGFLGRAEALLRNGRDPRSFRSRLTTLNAFVTVVVIDRRRLPRWCFLFNMIWSA